MSLEGNHIRIPNSHVFKSVIQNFTRNPLRAFVVLELGDFSINIVFSAWVDQRSFDYLKVRSEALRIVKDALVEAGVALPEPSSTVHLREMVPDAEVGEPTDRRRTAPLRRSAAEADVDREQHLDR